MSARLKSTPLYAVHLELGAKLVDFAGWNMPLHYGSQLEEHHQVRRDAGMFDVSHMLAIDVRGAQAREFLQRMLANDVARLASPGKALYSCMLAETGGVLDDLIVYAQPGGAYRLVVNAGTADKDLAWLAAHLARGGYAAELVPRRDLAIIAIQGPGAREKFWIAEPKAKAVSAALANFQAAKLGALFIARTGYTGEDGFELMLPAADAEPLWRALARAGVSPAGLAARDTLRLEAGMNLYGQDMDERVTPYDCGLAWTVDLRGERDFLGRAALSQTQPEHEFLGLVLESRGVMRSHGRVRTACGPGEITSGGFSPTMNRSIGLARLPRGLAPGAPVEIEVRGQWLAGRVVKPPFVRRGKVLVAS